MKKKFKVNKIKCLFCNDIIESKTVHDYKRCKCGKVAVDGGTEYLKRMFPGGMNIDDCFEDMSEYIDDGDK